MGERHARSKRKEEEAVAESDEMSTVRDRKRRKPEYSTHGAKQSVRRYKPEAQASEPFPRGRRKK